MKRQASLLIVLFVTVVALFLALRRHPGSVGPKSVAMGRTMTLA
jgi:hypothetical protein